MPENGELALLVSPKNKRYLIRVGKDDAIHTHDGYIKTEALVQAGYGSTLPTHLGRPYRVLRPTLYDLVKGVKRQTQIIYPKDIGYIIMRLSIGPGCRVIEAGSGSGSLTVALSWFAGPEGKVYTHEKRPEFKELCARNLAWAGLGENVVQTEIDIAEGFAIDDADALFLDVRTPWDYLHHVAKSVKPGAPLGFLLPTVNQVSMLIEGLEKGPFAGIEVVEIMLRRYKPVPDRLRPEDRMVAHTGFLVFARQQDPEVVAPVTEPVQESTEATGDDASDADEQEGEGS